ncbi:hypothetical protein ACI65C_005970 [Semiaphis heraclei]
MWPIAHRSLPSLHFICGPHSKADGTVFVRFPAGEQRTNMADEIDAQNPKTTSARSSLGACASHWPWSFFFATTGG